jgi:hypothetical protein
MAELVISKNILPEPLFSMIQAEKVKISESNGVVSLTPILGMNSGCQLRRLAADSNLTVDKFIAMKQVEKDLER